MGTLLGTLIFSIMHGFYDFILCISYVIPAEEIKEMGKMIRVCEGSCGIVSFTNTVLLWFSNFIIATPIPHPMSN